VQALPRAKNISLRGSQDGDISPLPAGRGPLLGEIGAPRLFGDVSFPLSMEALGHAVGGDDDGPATLDASRRGCGVRAG
jgi:hypothetical protein